MPEIKEISTFVFFDLETTGYNDEPRILELSLIAISRNDLLVMRPKLNPTNYQFMPPPLPRVTHKYRKFYYPRQTIRKEVEEINGLCNDMLYTLDKFKELDVASIKNFLDFPKPVCLVAHNGYAFDFEVLKAEMCHLGFDATHELDHLLCFDTLLALRKIHNPVNYLENANLSIQESTKEEPEVERTNMCVGELTKSDFEINLEEKPESLQSEQESTPQKISHVQSTPKTPSKSKCEAPTAFTPDANSKINATHISRIQPAVKRRLNYDRFRTPFSQPVIYQCIYKQSYSAHDAESDCIALAQIFAFYSEALVAYAIDTCISFQDVRPKWHHNYSQIKTV